MNLVEPLDSLVIFDSHVQTYYPILLDSVHACLAVFGSMALAGRTNPVSLILEGPSGYGKTAVVKMFFPNEDSELEQYVYRSDKFTPKAFALSFVIAIAAVLAVPDLLSSTGRFGFWKYVFDMWVNSDKQMFGFGTGAGAVVFQHTKMIWAHNDYLQLLFDNGMAGLSAALVVLFYALKESLDRPWLFSSIMGYASCAVFNFPSHMPLHAFVGLSLVWFAHRKVQ